ncbi:MAG: hypothetical protein ACXAD7_03990 [Candidatus Kariarchaeaceae archaeon]|jgi:hypothetical protein
MGQKINLNIVIVASLFPGGGLAYLQKKGKSYLYLFLTLFLYAGVHPLVGLMFHIYTIYESYILAKSKNEEPGMSTYKPPANEEQYSVDNGVSLARSYRIDGNFIKSAEVLHDVITQNNNNLHFEEKKTLTLELIHTTFNAQRFDMVLYYIDNLTNGYPDPDRFYLIAISFSLQSQDASAYTMINELNKSMPGSSSVFTRVFQQIMESVPEHRLNIWNGYYQTHN